MITIICGPPCAGKTTFVQEHAVPGDTIVDFDEIARSLGSPNNWQHAEPWKSLAQAETIDRIAAINPTDTAWIIRSDIIAATALAESFDGELIIMDPGQATCLARAESRPSGTRKVIRLWYWRLRSSGSNA